MCLHKATHEISIISFEINIQKKDETLVHSGAFMPIITKMQRNQTITTLRDGSVTSRWLTKPWPITIVSNCYLYSRFHQHIFNDANYGLSTSFGQRGLTVQCIDYNSSILVALLSGINLACLHLWSWGSKMAERRLHLLSCLELTVLTAQRKRHFLTQTSFSFTFVL